MRIIKIALRRAPWSVIIKTAKEEIDRRGSDNLEHEFVDVYTESEGASNKSAADRNDERVM